MISLDPGSYTAVLRGKNGAIGTALLEIYDLTTSSDSKLFNLSARSWVDAENQLIAGVIAGGDGPGNTDFVIRAIGPDLADAGIPDALPDPSLELRDSNGTLVASNNDQDTNVPGDFHNSPVAGGYSNKDSLMRVSLAPARYTAVVRSVTGAGGLALVEVDDLNR